MRARLSALPLRGAVVAVALLLSTGSVAPKEEPEPSPSEAPPQEAPSHAASTAPDFTADSVSVEFEEALLAELGEQSTTLAGESALAAPQDSDDMIETSGVSPEDCAPAPGLVVTTETSLVMDEELTEAPEDSATNGATEAVTDAPSGTAATPSLDLNPTLAVYVPAGTDLSVDIGDADTDTDAAVELIERLRERLES